MGRLLGGNGSSVAFFEEKGLYASPLHHLESSAATTADDFAVVGHANTLNCKLEMYLRYRRGLEVEAEDDVVLAGEDKYPICGINKWMNDQARAQETD